MTFKTLDDFDDGDISEWTNRMGYISTVTNPVESGSHAVTVQDENGKYEIYEAAERSVTPEKYERIRFYFRETTNNSNLGLGLYNGSTLIVGAGTDNPAWEYKNDSSSDANWADGGSYYDIWTRVTFDFDWSSGTVDINWRYVDGSESDTQTGISLNSNSKIDTIRLGSNENTTTANEAWIDSIYSDPPYFPITIDGEKVQEITIDGQSVQSLTIDGTNPF